MADLEKTQQGANVPPPLERTPPIVPVSPQGARPAVPEREIGPGSGEKIGDVVELLE